MNARAIMAKALWDAAWVGDITNLPWHEQPEHDRELYLSRADLQLAALAEAGIVLCREAGPNLPSGPIDWSYVPPPSSSESAEPITQDQEKNE